MDISHFIYSAVDGQLNCFHVEGIVNDAAVNIHVKVLCGCMLSSLLGVYMEWNC